MKYIEIVTKYTQRLFRSIQTERVDSVQLVYDVCVPGHKCVHKHHQQDLRPWSTLGFSPTIRSVATGNHWSGPVKSCILWFRRSAPPVSGSNWWEHQTKSESGFGSLLQLILTGSLSEVIHLFSVFGITFFRIMLAVGVMVSLLHHCQQSTLWRSIAAGDRPEWDPSSAFKSLVSMLFKSEACLPKIHHLLQVFAAVPRLFPSALSPVATSDMGEHCGLSSMMDSPSQSAWFWV